jgi:hypothetical protein
VVEERLAHGRERIFHARRRLREDRARDHAVAFEAAHFAFPLAGRRPRHYCPGMVESHPSGGYILEELSVGMTAEKRVTVTEARIAQFAEASDDFNPVHMDEAFASRTA